MKVGLEELNAIDHAAIRAKLELIHDLFLSDQVVDVNCALQQNVIKLSYLVVHVVIGWIEIYNGVLSIELSQKLVQ